MKKFLSVLVLISALIVGGCGGSSFKGYCAENEIRIESENEDNNESLAPLTIPEGSGIHVDANISAGKFIITIEGNEYEIDKSGESFIEVPAGERDVFMAAKSGLTGKIVLTVVKKNPVLP